MSSTIPALDLLNLLTPCHQQAIDKTRSLIQTIQSLVYSDPPDLSCARGHSATHFHETDFLSKVIRDDRDLLDLISMVQVGLLQLPSPGIPVLLVESTSRVRQGLKVLAFYAKVSFLASFQKWRWRRSDLIFSSSRQDLHSRFRRAHDLPPCSSARA